VPMPPSGALPVSGAARGGGNEAIREAVLSSNNLKALMSRSNQPQVGMGGG